MAMAWAGFALIPAGLCQPGIPFQTPFKYAWCDALAVQPDGKILAGGSFETAVGLPLTNFARFLPDGSPDTSFMPDSLRIARTIAVQDDGKILIAGVGEFYYELMRFTQDGTKDTQFQTPTNLPIVALSAQTMLLQADQKIVTLRDGHRYSTNVARWRNDGSPDTSFSLDELGVTAISLQGDGSFVTWSETSYLINGFRGILSGFTPGGQRRWQVQTERGERIEGMLPQGGGTLLFEAASGRLIGRAGADGARDTQFSPPGNSRASVALQTDGKPVLVGNIQPAPGEDAGWTACRLNSDGSVDDTFPVRGLEAMDSPVAIEPDGSVLYFSPQGKFDYLVRMPNPTPAWDTLEIAGTEAVWKRAGSAPLAQRVAFLRSADGTNWTSLGAGVETSAGWRVAGLNLQPGEWLKARGYVQNLGSGGPSQWYVETQARAGAPVITRHPASRENHLGGRVAFGASVAGSGPLGFQWLKDGMPVAGATEAGLVLAHAGPGDAGLYELVATNAVGSVTSAPARLDLLSEPAIVTHPFNAAPLRGGAFVLKAQVIGAEPLTFQWKKDGTNLPGATASSLVISNATVADRGYYSLEVTNIHGAVASKQAYVRMPDNPVITLLATSNDLARGGLFSFKVSYNHSERVIIEQSSDSVNWTITSYRGVSLDPGNFTWTVAPNSPSGYFRARAE